MEIESLGQCDATLCGGDGERCQAFGGGSHCECGTGECGGDAGGVDAVCRVGVAGEVVAKADAACFAFRQVVEMRAGHPVEVFFQVGVIVGVVRAVIVVSFTRAPPFCRLKPVWDAVLVGVPLVVAALIDDSQASPAFRVTFFVDEALLPRTAASF